ncbi:hypothetical protein AB4254_12215 [Vibrio breoganii]
MTMHVDIEGATFTESVMVWFNNGFYDDEDSFGHGSPMVADQFYNQLDQRLAEGLIREWQERALRLVKNIREGDAKDLFVSYIHRVNPTVTMAGLESVGHRSFTDCLAQLNEGHASRGRLVGRSGSESTYANMIEAAFGFCDLDLVDMIHDCAYTLCGRYLSRFTDSQFGDMLVQHYGSEVSLECYSRADCGAKVVRSVFSFDFGEETGHIFKSLTHNTFGMIVVLLKYAKSKWGVKEDVFDSQAPLGIYLCRARYEERAWLTMALEFGYIADIENFDACTAIRALIVDAAKIGQPRLKMLSDVLVTDKGVRIGKYYSIRHLEFHAVENITSSQSRVRVVLCSMEPKHLIRLRTEDFGFEESEVIKSLILAGDAKLQSNESLFNDNETAERIKEYLIGRYDW